MVAGALGALLALTVGAVYAETIAGLVRQWTSSPDASYGLVLAAVALAVLWKRRHALAHACADAEAGTGIGLAALLFGVVVYVVGQLGADVFLTRLSFVLVVAGLLWFAAGAAAIRVAAAPLLFLLIAIPLPELVVNAVTLPMQMTASRIAEQAIGTCGIAVLRDGNVLVLPSGSLEVAEACSGLRSAVSLAAIAMLLAWTEPSWPRRMALVLASIPTAIVMNGLRITATALASETWGADAATGSWHEFTGWITFVASLVVLLAIRRMMTGPRAPGAAATAAVTA